MDQSRPYRTIYVNNPRVENVSLILMKNPPQVTILIQEISTDIADIHLHSDSTQCFKSFWIQIFGYPVGSETHIIRQVIEAVFLYSMSWIMEMLAINMPLPPLHQSKSGDGLSLHPQIHYW